jgi:phospholipase/lecithinase/hemolysin
MAWCWRAASEALFADHVHPNEKGQALVAKIVARTVQVRRATACASGTCGIPGEGKAICGN